ncbi:MAG TPA: hypothetical protein VGH74_12550, partial [Planctomycetaceae bacterium]
FPDVVKAIAAQTGGIFEPQDFMPLPCAHPNCHSLTYAYRQNGVVVPLTRFINVHENMDLLANGITFTRPRARQLIQRYLDKLGCCGGSCDGGAPADVPVSAAGESSVLPLITEFDLPNGPAHEPSHKGSVSPIATVANEFFAQALAEKLSPADVFRITITSFLDAYNFDVRRLMKCCVHHVLPSGHVIPFCAYNVLYREGHVPLPDLQQLAMATR